MSLIQGNEVIAGSLIKANSILMEDYLNSVIAIFTEEEWSLLSDEDKKKYKLALVY